MHKEWRRRYPEPPPSLRTIQRVLTRHHLTTQTPKPRRHAYRPHPDATFPDAVHATDIITRWITGGEVVQTFNTVEVSSNDVYSTSHATKTAVAACEHLLQTWQQLGIPDVAQFDNESAFSGGNHPWVLGKVVRLCLYMGIEVLFIPLGEPDYNSPVETFNHLWAQQFWGRHHFTRRRDVSRVWRTFLPWYRSQYLAPRQSDTPERMRLGAPVYTLTSHDATRLLHRLPICVGCACGTPRLARRSSPVSQSNAACGQTLPRALRLAHLGDSPPASAHLVSSPCRSAMETDENGGGTDEGTCGGGAQTFCASPCRTATESTRQAGDRQRLASDQNSGSAMVLTFFNHKNAWAGSLQSCNFLEPSACFDVK
jgi:hypothetical protein